MSYDIRLKDPVTGDTIQLDAPHSVTGGTYVIGGTNEAWFNITYNYSRYYYTYINENRCIRYLYGKTGSDSIPILEDAISKMKDDTTSNYWDATEGNARAALIGLLELAKLCPSGIWDGD
jgi:hypothetical protein